MEDEFPNQFLYAAAAIAVNALLFIIRRKYAKGLL